MVRNDYGLYEGDLRHYLRVIFKHATNVNNPYHNFRHMLHVTLLCYEACKFYVAELSPRQARNLLIAAMFHDFNHSGKSGDDHEEIQRALRALREHILSEDVMYLLEIEEIIEASEYPHRIHSSHLSLQKQILRDCDMGQAFSVAWIQQVVYGLAEEWNKDPLETLEMQEGFLRSLRFETAWGKIMFPQEVINTKILEAQELFCITQG